MNKPTIIILVFNSLKFIKPCLDSVYAQDCKDCEVIVIDNGSSDGTVGFIKKNYPAVKLIENKDNLGACKARNQGIKIAQGDWILSLDCDVILEKYFLTKMLSFTEKSEESIGMIQPKILNNDKKTIYSCGIHLSWLKRFHDLGKGRFDNGQFNVALDIFGACSAAAVYRRKMLEDIKENTGYFDESFFFLAEDVDLSWRAQIKGWKAKFLPEAICYHSGNSAHFANEFRQYLCWRNRRFLLEKMQLGMPSLIVLRICYELPRFIFLFLTNPYVRSAVVDKKFRNGYSDLQ